MSEAASINISIWLWKRVIADLRRRSGRKRESGAFLLGRKGAPAPRIVSYICYDDIDPGAYKAGAIAFHARGYAALWQNCRERNLNVLADVHSHPGPDVRQSQIDQQNPMVPVAGHMAIIVPNFAQAPWWSLTAAGVYEYLGNFQWQTHDANKSHCRIKLTFW